MSCNSCHVVKHLRRFLQVTVSVRVIFMKLGTIDTIHDRFSADVTVLSKWREPALDNRKQVADDNLLSQLTHHSFF